MSARGTTRAGGHSRSVRGGGARRWRRLPAFLALLLAATLIQLGTAAPAQAVLAGGFEIDGDTVVNGGGLDWATTGVHQSDPKVPGPDTSNFQGSSKEFDDPSTWATATGVAPNQDDITDVYVHTLTQSSAVWAFFGFRRVATTGVTNYDVELNQRDNSSLDPPRPVRTVNDLLLQVSQDGNAAFTVDRLLLWTAKADFIAGCLPVGSGDFGWCPRPVPAGAWSGATGEGGLFAEGALNISALSFPGDCRGEFGTLNIRSFTGNDDQSALKDYVDAMDVAVAGTCVAPLSITNTPRAGYDVEYDWRVHKSVDSRRREVAAGTEARFGYTLVLEALPAGAPTNRQLGGTVTLTNPNTHTAVTATLDVAATSDPACTVLGADADAVAAGHQVSVPAATAAGPGGGSYDYTCDPGTSDGSSTATVSWSQARYPQPAGGTYTRSDTRSYRYLAQESDESASVTDAFDGGTPQPQGSATYSWSDVWAAPNHQVTVATYSRDLAGVPGRCTSYPNTATATEGDTGETTTDTETVTVCVGVNLDVDKVATLSYRREYLWDIAKSGPDTVFIGPDAAGNLVQQVTYQVDLSATGYRDTGQTLGGTLFVDNPNHWQAVTATLGDVVTVDGVAYPCTIAGTDAVPATATFEVVVPAGADNQQYPYSCPAVPQGDYVGTNTATITWDSAAYHTPTGSDSQTRDVTVTADPAPRHAAVTLSDRLDGAVSALLPQTSFDWATVRALSNSTQRITYSAPLTTTPGACTPHVNRVVIDQTGQAAAHTVDVCSPGVTKTVLADFGRRQLWTVTKDVDATTAEVADGASARFTYTVNAVPGQVVDDGSASWTGAVRVANPSATASLSVDVVDTPAAGDWTCAFTSSGTARLQGVVVAAGATATLPYTCTGTGHPDGENTATVSFGDEQVSRTVGVGFTARSGVADSVVTLTDDIDNDGAAAERFTVDVADPASWTRVYTRTLTGPAGVCTDYTNTAVIDLSAGPDPDPARRTVTVCVEAPPSLAATAAASLVRSYAWSIDKAVDQTRRTVDPATGTARFHYTVRVAAGASTDSGWRLGGTVAVTNPNAYLDGAISADVSVASDLGGGVTCVVEGGQDVLVPPRTGEGGGVVTLPYACTFASRPADAGEVTATVAWNPPGPDEAATRSATAPVGFGVRAEVDKVVDVVDDQTRPGQRVALAEDLVWEPGLTRTYEYDLALPGTVGQCVDFTNTAVVDLAGTADPSDSASVSVCMPRAPLAAVVRTDCTGYEVLLDNTGSAVAVSYVIDVAGTPREVTVAAGASQRATGTLPAGTVTVTVSSAGRQLASGTRSETCIEVLPAEASGKLTGDVRASCQGTVRARMRNTTEQKVVFTLAVGRKRHTLGVKPGQTRRFQTTGRPRARVLLKVGPRVLDRVRIPRRCAPPEVLPDTGLRPTLRSAAREDRFGTLP